MSKRVGAGALLLGGLAVCILGYTEPTLIGGGSRPYAYLSVMAVGAIFIFVSLLLWRDS